MSIYHLVNATVNNIDNSGGCDTNNIRNGANINTNFIGSILF